jgi:hypothetical protein
MGKEGCVPELQALVPNNGALYTLSPQVLSLDWVPVPLRSMAGFGARTIFLLSSGLLAG